MAFINNKKFLEIKNSAKDGDEKALKVLEALKKGSNQDRINELIEKFYQIDTPPILETPIPTPSEPQIEVSQIETPISTMEVSVEPQVIDLTDTLDKELDGILDEIEISDMSFIDFLKDKKKNGNRMRKDNAYFKAFDPQSKEMYIIKKQGDYAKKFDSKLDDIERNYRDIDVSLDEYLTNLNDMLDDSVELDMNIVGNAYNDIIDNENTMKKFNRYWDWMDNEDMNNILKDLVTKYGKKNVQSALTTLKSDNDNYHSYKKNQVDEEIGRYNKALEKLLK